jgi:hypothetical protein
MDLERSQIIDLLPERSADSFARWLGLHPEVEVITRDRSSLYADGGRQGASSSVQITDRYHLVSNLSEAVEHDVQQLLIDARKQLAQSEAQGPGATNKLPQIETRRQRCRQARYQGYTKVHELQREGHTQLQIAEQVGIGTETVSRWLNAPEIPERRIRSDRRRDQALFLQSRERDCSRHSLGPTTPPAACRRYSICRHELCRRHRRDIWTRSCAFATRLTNCAICSPVSSHAALAKCEEAEYLDSIGGRFWIPLHGPVCENATPRFGSSETIDDNAMEQWPS